jgi:hypothetical protein
LALALHNRSISYRFHCSLLHVSPLSKLFLTQTYPHRFIIPDFPHTTSWLSDEEKAIATRRLRDSSGSHDADRGSLFSGLKMAVLDYKVWLLSLIIVTKTSAGAVTSFIPTLVATFGYDKVQSLLLVAPPYVFATIVALLVSWSSDKRGERAFHIIVPIFFGMSGYIIAASTMVLGARYVGVFLMLGGVYGSYNVALAWISSTVWLRILIGLWIVADMIIVAPTHRKACCGHRDCQRRREYSTSLFTIYVPYIRWSQISHRNDCKL